MPEAVEALNWSPLQSCHQCGLELPILVGGPASAARLIECVSCNNTYVGRFDSTRTALVKNIRMLGRAATPGEQSSATATQPVAEPKPKPSGIKVANPAAQAAWDRVDSGQDQVAGRLDALFDNPQYADFHPGSDPFSNRVKSHGASMYSPERVLLFSNTINKCEQEVGRLYPELQRGNVENITLLGDVADDSARLLAEDMDLAICSRLPCVAESKRHEHSLNVAMLAMAIATDMRFGERALTELAMGCLLHDVGMDSIPGGVHNLPRQLTADEFELIKKHPLVSCEMLSAKLELLPFVSRMVIYQMHERLDGSGYPRGLKGNRIHRAAQIAAVADSYVAMTSDRPHRPAMLPYDAIKRLLMEVRANRLASDCVRSLLHVISIFPIGSYVELTDGSAAKVIRANGVDYCRPVVTIPDSSNIHQIVDLKEQVSLAVVRPLVGFNRKLSARA